RSRKHAIEDIAEIGRHLAESEDHVGHGNRGVYLAWIGSEFGWSDQTARRFIHVYKVSLDPEFNNLLNLDCRSAPFMIWGRPIPHRRHEKKLPSALKPART